MNYFENCKTAEEIKKQYWKLCRKFHPDMNPDSDTETMAEINNQYEKAMKTKTTEYGEDKFMKIVNRLAKYQRITTETTAKRKQRAGCQWIRSETNMDARP